MIKRIIDDIKKKGRFSFEKVIEDNTLSDNDFFEILKFIYTENIPEIRTSVDGKDFIVLENENFYLEEKDIIKSYLEDIKEKYTYTNKNDNNKELIDKYLKVAVKESLIHSKYGFSFLDLVQEATLGVISGLNYYDEILKISNNPEFFVKNFAIKYILEFQKNLLKDIKASELSYILYLKIRADREMGYSTEEIAKQINVTVEYIEQLEKLFDEAEKNDIIDSDKIFEKADKITQMYVLENIPKKLSYIDEQILVMSYGLDNKTYTEKEIAKILNISHHNIKILREKALNKLAIDLLRNDFIRNNKDSEYVIN